MKYEYIPQPLPGVFASHKPGDFVQFDYFFYKNYPQITAVIQYINTRRQAQMRELHTGLIWWRDIGCLRPPSHTIAPPTLPFL